MGCRREEMQAKRARLLAKKAKEPNMTNQELAGYFAISLRTVAQWVAESGLGQLRTEDNRRRVQSRPPPVAVPPPAPSTPAGPWVQMRLVEVVPCERPVRWQRVAAWRPRARAVARLAQEAFAFLASMPIRARVARLA